MSRRYCLHRLDSEHQWIDYQGVDDLVHYLESTPGFYNLVVTDPEVIVSSHALDRMIRMAEHGFTICGPVFNHTSFEEQQAPLPIPYCNFSTFEEITKEFFAPLENHFKPTTLLDPVCFLLKGKVGPALKSILNGDIPPSLSAGIEPSALVHRFSDYYFSERKDLVDLIPEGVNRVLDIGCAMGGYGKVLKAHRPEIFLTGVEPNRHMADLARPFYDELIVDTIENVSVKSRFDLINCGDVLEHLFNPCRMLHRSGDYLDSGGYLVFSVPNAGHWSIVKDLLKGEFRYVPVGLQCVTHIRWFTEKSLGEMLEESGFEIDVLNREKMPITPEGLRFISDLCAAEYGDRESLETFEITIRAIKK